MQRITGIAIAIVIAICAVMFRGDSAAKVEKKIAATSAKLEEVLHRAKDYDKHAAFLEENADAADKYAMEFSYTPPAPRTPPKFDHNRYPTAYCECLVSKVKYAKALAKRISPDLDQFVRQLQIDVEQAVKAGEFE
jgi:hypothetical protein